MRTIRESSSMILNYKTKPFLSHSHFKMSFTLFISNLLTDQHSSRGIMMMFTMLDFLWKIMPTSTMISAISRGESVEILLVPPWATIFRTDDGSGKQMARQNTFPTRSPLMPKFIVFSDTKYFSNTVWYRTSPAMMESLKRSVLGFVAFIVRQWLRWHSIQLDLPKRNCAFKVIKNIRNRKQILTKFVKLYFLMTLIVIYRDIKTWMIMENEKFVIVDWVI